jgi:hypothetical protein
MRLTEYGDGGSVGREADVDAWEAARATSIGLMRDALAFF